MEIQFIPWHRSLVRLVSIIALSVCAIGSTLLRGQNSAIPKAPEEVLRAYRKMEAEGERLTVAGWYKASNYFIKPERPPQGYTVTVTDGERVEGVRVNGPRAEGYVLCSGVGQIDSLGRFTSVVAPSLLDILGRPVKPEAPFMYGPTAPVERVYNLVLTETHWEFGPNGEGPRELKGPPEWRIEKFEFEPWISIEVAIRYLTKLRDESNSDVIKGNAEKSVATLRGLR
jgi:hypothetical protein